MRDDIKVYIAAPFFSENHLNVVRDIEAKLAGANLAYYSPRMEGVLKIMSPAQKSARMKFVFDKNIEMLNWCTHVVAFIDDYDTGTVFEMGYAFSAGKRVVTYTDNYYGINVMLNECIIGHCSSIENIVPALLGNFVGEKTGDVI